VVRRADKSASYASFAAIWFFVGGVFNVMAGLAALLKKSYFDEGELIYENLQAWGWGWIALGALGILAAWLVARGSQAGRALGVLLSVLGLSVWFLNVAAIPLWAIVNMVVYGLIIYGLTAYGEAFD
jgi:hypothetical protein